MSPDERLSKKKVLRGKKFGELHHEQCQVE
jgi:hypothetical protein